MPCLMVEAGAAPFRLWYRKAKGGNTMKTIITIGRQFGSGGKEVGIRVAKELGIPFYDKELLQEAAKKSGLCLKKSSKILTSGPRACSTPSPWIPICFLCRVPVLEILWSSRYILLPLIPSGTSQRRGLV